MPNYANQSHFIEKFEKITLHLQMTIPIMLHLVQTASQSDCCIITVIMYKYTKIGEKTISKKKQPDLSRPCFCDVLVNVELISYTNK